MIADNLKRIQQELGDAKLIVVSKYRSLNELQQVYDAGQRDFGENRVQALQERYDSLPKDIRWHMIGHLQRNKVKYIAPYVHLIHSVDSLKLLNQINKEAHKVDRVISVLLQLHLGEEETKFGMTEKDLRELLDWSVNNKEALSNINIKGMMGMASNVDDTAQVSEEFASLKKLFDDLKGKYSPVWPDFSILSMGMSGDYKVAIREGSNMVRIGSAIFSTF